LYCSNVTRVFPQSLRVCHPAFFCLSFFFLSLCFFLFRTPRIFCSNLAPVLFQKKVSRAYPPCLADLPFPSFNKRFPSLAHRLSRGIPPPKEFQRFPATFSGYHPPVVRTCAPFSRKISRLTLREAPPKRVFSTLLCRWSSHEDMARFFSKKRRPRNHSD